MLFDTTSSQYYTAGLFTRNKYSLFLIETFCGNKNGLVFALYILVQIVVPSNERSCTEKYCAYTQQNTRYIYEMSYRYLLQTVHCTLWVAMRYCNIKLYLYLFEKKLIENKINF